MKKNGEIDIKYEGNEDCLWDITVLDNTITFFSNGFYLKEENENVIGYKYMVIWNFKKLNDNNYYFISQKRKIIIFLLWRVQELKLINQNMEKMKFLN